MKTYFIEEIGLNFKYPYGWTVTKEGNFLSMYDSVDGVGVLQFSFFQVPNPSALSIKEELEDFVKDRHHNFKITVFKNHAETDYLTTDNNRIWKYWITLKGNTIIFITYNCQESDKGKEEDAINQIIYEALVSTP